MDVQTVLNKFSDQRMMNWANLLADFDKLASNININELTAEEVSIYYSLYEVAKELQIAANHLDDLNKKTLIEGYLKINSHHRYELNGYEISGDSKIDVWVDVPNLKDGGFYQSVFLQLINGEYLVNHTRQDFQLEGRKARLKL